MPDLRVPPCDVEAERALVGHMLYTNRSTDLDLTGLHSGHFYDPTCHAIWDAIRFLDSQNLPFDVVAVAARLNDQQKLQTLGGTAKIADIGMGAAVLGEVALRGHSQRLLTLWKARQFIGACQTGQTEMLASGADINEVILRYDTMMSELLLSDRSDGPMRFHDAVEATIGKLLHPEQDGVAVRSGFPTIDHHTGGGYHDGDIIIIAGRPGMGKTSFLLNTLVDISMRSRSAATALFSMEMPTLDLATRILCSEASLAMGDVRSGKINAAAWSDLTAAATKLSDIPFWIDDTSALTVQDLRARIRSIKRDLARVYGGGKKLRVVGVDYLQLMRGDRSPNREQEVSSITRGLKALAKDEEVCIIPLSQLNRDTERQSNKRPTLKDLRESGAIEQDADMVGFLYRESYYDDTADPNEGEYIIAKQRNGATVTIHIRWDAKRMKYTDLDRTHDYVDELDDIAEDWTP